MNRKQSTKKGGAKGKAGGSGKKENDAQLVRSVSTVITGANDSALFETLVQLEDETRVYAQHPKVVAAWLAVALEEARRMLKAKGTERLTRSGLRQTLAEVERLAAVGRSTATAATSEQTKAKGKDKAEVNHNIIAWALAGVLYTSPEGRDAQAVMEAWNRLGAAIGQPETVDLRAGYMLHATLDAHTSCAYDLDGQDGREGKKAYGRLVSLAGGFEGATEPKNKSSLAWLCWTLCRVRANFESGDVERYGRAWREFRELLFATWKDEGRNCVGFALAMLAPLVMGSQQAEEFTAKGRAHVR
jgi:hypothetical protein